MAEALRRGELSREGFEDIAGRVLHHARRLGLPSELSFVDRRARWPRRHRSGDGREVVYVPRRGRPRGEVLEAITRAVVGRDTRGLNPTEKAHHLKILRQLTERRGTSC